MPIRKKQQTVQIYTNRYALIIAVGHVTFRGVGAGGTFITSYARYKNKYRHLCSADSAECNNVLSFTCLLQ